MLKALRQIQSENIKIVWPGLIENVQGHSGNWVILRDVRIKQKNYVILTDTNQNGTL